MKILLVQQDTGQRAITYPLYPIGLSYLAAALTHHEVLIFDPNVYAYPASLAELHQVVQRFRPDVVGISIRNVDTTQRKDLFVNFKTVKPTLETIQAVQPGVRIIAGGTGFSIHAREILASVPQIEFGVYLEGEESFPELLDNLQTPEKVKGIFYRRGPEVIFTGPRKNPDFASLPIPRRDPAVINMAHYQGPLHNIVGIQSKRGCVFSCSYCTYVFLNESRTRLRSAAHVVDEIEELVNVHGIKMFTFVDSVFNVPESHAREICHEIIRRKLDVTWGAWLTPIKISEDFLQLMRRAGCRHIGFSPDAVTDRGLKVLQKGFTAADVEHSLQLAKKLKDVAVGYSFFCAYPGMTWGEVWKTLVMFFRIPLALPGRGGVWLGWIRVEPGTDIFKTAVEEGVMPADIKMLPDTEEELAKLFYVPKRQFLHTILFEAVLLVVEKTLKPMVKGFFRIIGRIRGKAALYDQ